MMANGLATSDMERASLHGLVAPTTTDTTNSTSGTRITEHLLTLTARDTWAAGVTTCATETALFSSLTEASTKGSSKTTKLQVTAN